MNFPQQLDAFGVFRKGRRVVQKQLHGVMRQRTEANFQQKVFREFAALPAALFVMQPIFCSNVNFHFASDRQPRARQDFRNKVVGQLHKVFGSCHHGEAAFKVEGRRLADGLQAEKFENLIIRRHVFYLQFVFDRFVKVRRAAAIQ